MSKTDDLQSKFTSDDLKTMQNWSLEHKIAVTQAKILEFSQKFDNKIYVSFSGGKDSTVLLDITRKLFPNVVATYIDTGLEYPEVRQFALSTDNVTVVKPEMNFRKVIEKYGYPIISKEVAQKIYEARKTPCGVCAARFRPDHEYATKYGGRYSMVKWTWLKDSDIPISHMCCTIMKKRPAHKFEKESGLHPIIATMACESSLRKTKWLKTGCNAFDAKRPTSQPMSFWTEQDVLKYIVKYNLGYASVYGDIKQDESGKYYTTGCDRTGCVFCGFGCHLEKEPNRFQRLKETHPKLWEYCLRDWDDGGLGMRKVLDFIGVKYM